MLEIAKPDDNFNFKSLKYSPWHLTTFMVVFKVHTLIYKILYVDLLQIVCHVCCAHHTLISSTFQVINNMIILKCYGKREPFK